MMSALLIGLAVLAGMPLLGWAVQRVGTTLDRLRYPAPGRLVQVGGHKLHIVRTTPMPGAPARPTVVFEAGIGASSLSWSRVAPEIEPFFPTAAYDRAGLGWSEAATTPRTTKQVNHELFALLDNAGIQQPVILVGHSFGGMTALSAACTKPERVAGVVLVDPLTPPEWALPSPPQKRMLEYGVHLAERGAALARFGVVRTTLRLAILGSHRSARWISQASAGDASSVPERLIGEVRKLPPSLWPVVRAHWSAEKTFWGMADHLRQLPLSSVQAANSLSRGLDVPLVVISAANVEEFRLASHKSFAALSPEGEHWVAESGGHWVMLDEPDIVVRAIRRVVEQSQRI